MAIVYVKTAYELGDAQPVTYPVRWLPIPDKAQVTGRALDYLKVTILLG